MMLHPSQALGVSLTASCCRPVLAVVSSHGVCCTPVCPPCTTCGVFGGLGECCAQERVLRSASAVAVACCCCVSCSHDTGGGSFYTAVGTRPVPPPRPHIKSFSLCIGVSLFSFLRPCSLCSDGRVLMFEAEEDVAAVSLLHVVSTEAAGAVISLFWSPNFVSAGDMERDASRWAAACARNCAPV